MIIFNANNKIKARPASETIQLSAIPYEISEGGTRTADTTQDVIYDVITSATVKTAWNLSISRLPIEAPFSILVDPAKLVLDKNAMTVISADTKQASIRIDTANSGAIDYKVVARVNGTTAIDHTGYSAGALGENASSQIAGLISGLTYSNSIAQYMVSNNGDFTAPSITVNSNCFAGGLDLSGISVMSEGNSDDRYPLTLISPRHAIIAKHVTPYHAIGSKVVFKLPDDSYHVATIVSIFDLPDAILGFHDALPDLSVVYLDADVTGAKVYKVFNSTDLDTYVPSMSGISISGITRRFYFPVLRKAMHYADGTWGSAFQLNTLYARVSGLLYNVRSDNTATSEIPWYDWGYPSAIPGDSGSPSFALVNNDPILLTTQHSTAEAEDMSSFVDSINIIMNDLAGVAQGTYVLQHPDLSGFASYI